MRNVLVVYLYVYLYVNVFWVDAYSGEYVSRMAIGK